MFSWAHTACAHPDYTTSHGIAVYKQGNVVDNRELEILLDETFKAGGQHWDEIFLRKSVAKLGTELYFESESFACPTADNRDRKCWGTIDDSFTFMRIVATRCLAASAISHEMAHIFGYLVLGDSDPFHENVELFFAPGSVSRDGAWNSCALICPELCGGAE